MFDRVPDTTDGAILKLAQRMAKPAHHIAIAGAASAAMLLLNLVDIKQQHRG